MDYINGFSIFEQLEPVNHDITISFNPDSIYNSYTLIINKDGEVYKEIRKINLVSTEFTLSETGIYSITVLYYDMDMNEVSVSSGSYIIDKEAPVLKVGRKSYDVFLDRKFDIMDGVSATDNIDGNITDSIVTNRSSLDFNTKGSKKLVYTVYDRAGNMATDSVLINISNSSMSILLFQMFFMVVLLICAAGIFIYNKSLSLEKRISKFSISPLNDNSLSLFDSISRRISFLVEYLNKYLYKSEFIKKYSKKYIRYLRISNGFTKTSMDFVSIKFLSSILCIVIAVFSKTVRFKIFNVYDIYIPLLFGFFLPDFIYYFKYKSYKKVLEDDLLQAIIIMNNAFKSGRSIIQAIDLVSLELDGAIADEFRKMKLELSFGLGIDVVFKRLYDRLRIEEIAYLTSSLTILNQTGGNIVQVFSSIEKSLFNKKKLRLELKSLTSGSRIIVNVLIIVPIAFVLLVWLINPSYFLPLLTNDLGIIIICIVFVYYILYIFVIKRLLRVKI